MAAARPVAETAPRPDAVRSRGERRRRRGWIVRRALLAADIVGLAVAFFVVETLFPGRLGGLGALPESGIFALLLPLWVVAAKLYGLYDRDEERASHSTADDVMRVFHLVTVGVWLFYATSWFDGLARPDQAKLSAFWLLALVGVVGMRVVARALVRRHPAYVQNTLIVGAGDVGQLVARKVLQHPEYHINLVGFADAGPKELRRDLNGVQVIGDLEQVVDLVGDNDVDRVVLAFSRERGEELLAVVRALRAHDVQIDVVPRLFDTVAPNSALHSIEGLPLMSVASSRISPSSRLLKRAIDVVGAGLLLVLTAPLLLAVAVLIRLDSPGRAFFRQERLGMDMRRFTVLKFRTMSEGTDDAPHRDYLRKINEKSALPEASSLYKLDRGDAVTRIGRLLRRTSLDELPQLVNVLRGEMSLVGPRPAIPSELELYEPHHLERFAVPAGLTGLWQVEARAHATFREALDLDVLYVHGWSLGLDLSLLLRTPLLMLRERETG